MTTGRISSKKPTIVWCLAITNDFTIISGDSRGKLTFWDGNSGSQIESFQTHRADILTICMSEDQKELHCSGVDTNIASYSKIHLKDDSYKWVKNVQRRVQDHDVRSLIYNGKSLYSAGVDGYLYFISTAKKMHVKYSPINQIQVAAVCRNERLIMFKYPRHLEVWSLGEASKINQGSKIFNLETEPKRLLVITSDTKHEGYEGREGIMCSCISDDGNWIAYSTHSKLSVLSFSYVSIIISINVNN